MAKKFNFKELEDAIKLVIALYNLLPHEDKRTAEKFKERLHADLERAKGIVKADEEREAVEQEG
jgi:hypothetical protein